MGTFDKKQWEKNTIIKDAVHGYINVPKPIAKMIIDTDVFQRLKNIEQTGMQVLYPSATHNRFMHSLGVYHLSKKAFHHFKANVQTDAPAVYESLANRYVAGDISRTGGKVPITGAESVWRRWELLFQLASLLHDCGHSPFSHTLEFVYDLAKVQGAPDQHQKILDQCLMNVCSEAFKEDFEAQAKEEEKESVGKPHERMSALFIALKGEDSPKETKTGQENEKSGQKDERSGQENGSVPWGGYKDRIKILVDSYLEGYGLLNYYEECEGSFDDDIEFMVRMIIGCKYRLERSDKYRASEFYESAEQEKWQIELQLRNCVIAMLNSKLDVDNLDYVVRDSKYSGYASNNIDLERLLSSFTVIQAYEFKEENPLLLNKEDFFEGSVNLVNFTGNYIDARISGECAILSGNKDITAKGNIHTEAGDLSPEARRMAFRTTDKFSATVKAEEEDSAVTIKAKKDGEEAYIHISGRLKGEFYGTVLGDTYQGCGKEKEGVRKVYFAYRQSCMSVLMSAIDGSNFENEWIYAHHTTTFHNNFLVVYLLERYAEYLVDCEAEAFLKEMNECLGKPEFFKNAGDCTALSEEKRDELEKVLDGTILQDAERYSRMKDNIGAIGAADADAVCALLKDFGILRTLSDRTQSINKGVDNLLTTIWQRLSDYIDKKQFCDAAGREKIIELQKKYENLRTSEIQYFSEILEMHNVREISGNYFYRMDDKDLLAKFKQAYFEISTSLGEQTRYQEFMISYQCMASRKSMRCMWKTFPEYHFYFSDWTEEEIEGFKNLIRRRSTPWGEAVGEEQQNYAILSDYVTLSDDAKELWNYLKKEYGFCRLVYVEQKIRTKSFERYKTYIRNNERVLRLEDVKLYRENRKENPSFFYIYYDLEEKKVAPDTYMVLQEIRNRVKEIQKEDEKKKEYLEPEMGRNGNMIIRDNVHGDITFSPFFTALVDTKEFQRLRRVKQLATAGKVFPGAVHTRFEHSIGTYHIMRKIVEHFKTCLKRINSSLLLDEKEETAILAAALLHDLGHGPYSHAFEKAGLAIGDIDHAKWTVKIIEDSQTEVNAVLENLEEGFAKRVSGYIEYENEIKHNDEREIGSTDGELNFRFIFASLVSGQIDADRMDYLLRDAKNVGVPYGQFDLERMIEGLTISVDNTGQYRVCLLEDYVPDAEEYFYARYQMYNNVYYHPYKLFSEELFRRILKEAQKRMLEGALSQKDVPPSLENIFIRSVIGVDQYCYLDDLAVDGAIQTWAMLPMSELSFMCKALLKRRGFQRLEIADLSIFKEKASKIFGEDIFRENCLIEKKKNVQIYEEEKPVFVLNKSGVIMKLQEYSRLIKEPIEESYIYYSREMAEKIYMEEAEKLDEFDRLIEQCSLPHNMEIEKKYVFDAGSYSCVEDELRRCLTDLGYQIETEPEMEQVDIYYDTNNFKLKKQNYTLRFRKNGNGIYITCKSSVSSESNGMGGQLERREIEEQIQEDGIENNRELIGEILNDIPDSENIVRDLTQKIRVENSRKKMTLVRNNGFSDGLYERYEMVLDNVKYMNLKNKREHRECQMELELKSSYQNRINMKILTDKLEKEIGHLKPIEESKYQRALQFTEEKVCEQ